VQLFHIIDDGVAILRVKGRVYRQAKIYHRGEDVFAGYGGGYVRLTRGGWTTMPDVSCIEVEGPGVVIRAGVPRFVEAEVDARQKAA
jgi:hypothetical protein